MWCVSWRKEKASTVKLSYEMPKSVDSLKRMLIITQIALQEQRAKITHVSDTRVCFSDPEVNFQSSHSCPQHLQKLDCFFFFTIS